MFAYNSASEKFHAEEHFKRFESYDKWKLKEFKQFLKNRYRGTLSDQLKRSVISDLFAMALELLRIASNDLIMIYSVVLMSLNLMCLRKHVAVDFNHLISKPV